MSTASFRTYALLVLLLDFNAQAEDFNFTCPSGFRVYNFTSWLQQCQVCGMGEECRADPCFRCAPCSRGTFKDKTGSHLCRRCPVNSYGPAEGALDSHECKECPPFSRTWEDGRWDLEHCECEGTRYLVNMDGVPSCISCPVGALCASRQCAFNALSSSVQTITGPACAENTTLDGTWERQTDWTWTLISCQTGSQLLNSYEGAPLEQFSHAHQRCAPCQRDEYIVDAKQGHTCQKCPLRGLICRGGTVVQPRTANSTWETVDGIYVLRTCPRGYEVFVKDIAQQECRDCGAGQECGTENCTACTLCQPGYHKPTAAPDLCQPCPRNTFSSRVGAAWCDACALGATTRSSGATSPRDCQCFPVTYSVLGAGDLAVSCKTCPIGAMCPDGSCALRWENQSCLEISLEGGDARSSELRKGVVARSITGTWEKQNGTTFVLLACPPGNRLINTTSEGTFSHDLQRCAKCRECKSGGWCRGADYIIDSVKHKCQPCPTGAECNGHALRTAGGLDALGASWSMDSNAGQWKLTRCPVGYRLQNLTGHDAQQCVRCPEGWFVADPSDPHLACNPCPRHALCLNRGPPLFEHSTVQARIFLSGVQEWDSLVQNALTSALAAPFGLQPHDVELLSVDPKRSTHQTRPALGLLQSMHHSETTSSRRILLAGGVAVVFRVPVGIGNEQEMVTNLTGQRFYTAVSSHLAEHIPSLSLQVAQTADVEVKRAQSVGAEYRLTGKGVPELVNCRRGYLVVNDSIHTQHCVLCPPGTYSLSPVDGCSIPDKALGCPLRSCNLCSVGAECRGGDAFEPSVIDSRWVPEFVTADLAFLYRIQITPPGYVLIRGDNPRDDQAVPCVGGYYALEQGSADGEVMRLRVHTAEALVGTEAHVCLPCPAGASCPGRSAVVAKKGWWRGTSMRCPPAACTKRGCSPSKCKALASGVEDGEALTRVRAMIYRCRRHEECQPETSAQRRAASDGPGNQCQPGHTGPLCSNCIHGWVRTWGSGQCIDCAGEQLTLAAILPLSILVFGAGCMYYKVFWLPVLRTGNALGIIKDKSLEDIEAAEERLSKLNRTGREALKGIESDMEAVKENIKITVTFFQIAGSYVTSFSVPWPVNLVRFVSIISSIVQLDIFSFPAPSCITVEFSLIFLLLAMTAAFVFAVTLLALPAVYVFMLHRKVRPLNELNELVNEIEEQWNVLAKRIGKTDHSARELLSLLRRLSRLEDVNDVEQRARVASLQEKLATAHSQYYDEELEAKRKTLETEARRVLLHLRVQEAEAKQRHRAVQGFKKYLFWLLFSIYPSASLLATRPLLCTNLGADGRWMRDDMKYPCPTPSSDPLVFFWGCAASVFIPIGVPCLFLYTLYAYGVPKLANAKKDAEIVSAFLRKMSSMETKLFNFKDKFGDSPDSQIINRKIKLAMKQVMKCVCHKCDACETVKCPDCNQCRHNRKKGINKPSIFGQNKKNKCPTCADYSKIKSNRVCVRCGFLATDNSAECKVLHPEDWKHEEVRWFGTKNREPEGFDIQKLGQLMWAMELTTFDDDDLIRLINLHGYAGKINRRQVRTAMRELCMRLKYKQIVVRGNENPNLLTDTQLKVLCEEPWERQVGYNHLTYASGVSGVLDGTSFMHAKAGLTDARGMLKPETYSRMTPEERREFLNNHDKYEYATRADLIQELRGKGKTCSRYGDCTFLPVAWDGQTAQEKKALTDIGVLFRAYKPSYWWFEVFELVRKVVNVVVLMVFFDGTPSQVGISLLLSLLSLCMAAAFQPFVKAKLQRNYLTSLGIQAISLLFGVFLSTGKFDEILRVGFFSEALLSMHGYVLMLPSVEFISKFFAVKDVASAVKDVARCCACWCCQQGKTRKTWIELGIISTRRAKMQKITFPAKCSPKLGNEVLPQAHGDDSDGESDKVIDSEWDAFQQMPTAAELGVIARMEQHCELIEARVFDLLRHQAKNEYGEEFDRALEDVKILLDRAKIDAAVLQEEMPTGEAQDQLEHIAFGTLDYIQVLCDNLAASNRPRTVDFELSSNHGSDWSAVLGQ